MANEKRLIDAEPIKKFIVDGLNNPDLKKAFGHDAIEILTEIEYAPTVDAVEVVRCKDCKWRKEWLSGGLFYCCNPSYGMASGVELKDDDFCSYGERREGE